MVVITELSNLDSILFWSQNICSSKNVHTEIVWEAAFAAAGVFISFVVWFKEWMHFDVLFKIIQLSCDFISADYGYKYIDVCWRLVRKRL